VIEATKMTEEKNRYKGRKPEELTTKELRAYVEQLEKEMRQAADDLQFERAAQLRDQIFEYRSSRL
jgi:excinuclease ABC subunit B